MPTMQEIYEEAGRRGILPPDEQSVYNEGVRRGLIGSPQDKARVRVERESGGMQTMDDSVRALARGVPAVGGAMDEYSATLNTGAGAWGNYDDELAYQRERDRSFDERHPVLSPTLQTIGAVGGSLALGKTAGVPQAPSTLPMQIAAGGGIGGGTAAVEGFTRGEGGMRERMASALEALPMGVGVGAAMPVIGRAIGMVRDRFAGPAKSGLTSKGMKGVGGNFMEFAKNSGLAIKPEKFDAMLDDLHRTIGPHFDPDLMPELATALKRIEKYRGATVPISEIDNIRRKIAMAYRPTNPEMARPIGMAKRRIDAILDELTPNDVVGGDDPSVIIPMLKQGRALYAKGAAAKDMEDLIQNARNAVGANYTEAGFQTAMRQKLRALASDDFEKARWVTPAMRKEILQILGSDPASPNTTLMENFLRNWGSFSPLTKSGLKKTAVATAGAHYFGGPLASAATGLVLGGGGTAARPVADKLMRNNTNRLVEMLLQGGPLPKEMTGQQLSALASLLSPAAGQSAARGSEDEYGRRR